ncbi:MAG: putative maltokinase, partial [Actinomycetota bacterium]|nr:putative maltokinase [Actinomycetota bacterium]
RDRRIPSVQVGGSWRRLFTPGSREALAELLPGYLRHQRWFGGKGRRIKSAEVVEVVPVTAQGGGRAQAGPPAGYITFVQVEYTDGDPETYVLPLAGAPAAEHERGAVARVHCREGEITLLDAVHDREFAETLLRAVARRRRLAGRTGKVTASPTPEFRRLRGAPTERLEPGVLQGEQSNTSIVYGDRLILKLFRRPDPGVNPDLEMGRFLTERAGFEGIPPVAGALEYRSSAGRSRLLGILQGYVANEGDAWTYTLDALSSFVEAVLTRAGDPPIHDEPALLDMAEADPPQLAHETIGPYLETARLLGRQTAELHVALASDPEDPAFAPERHSLLYQRSMYQSMRALANRVFHRLRRRVRDIPEAAQILELEDVINRRLRRVVDIPSTAVRTRVHGDYHLGQVLWTGKDFVIIDFEGEPARPIGERRLKRTPLRDVAGMLRSFHYAAYSTLLDGGRGMVRPVDAAELEPWLLFWYRWTASAFLRAYLDAARPGGVLPESREELEVLLDVVLLEKALYELGYEIDNRPDWVRIPIQGILQILEGGA